MDRQAIIERVVSRDIAVSGAAVILPKGVAQKLVKNILEAAGFFDLLEAAEVVASRRGKGSKAGRCDYGGLVPDSELWALYDAIRKAKGGTP